MECRGLTVSYGAEPILHNLDLTVTRGETVGLLGPPGSGKTTLLYAVAGFLRPASGDIRVSGALVASQRWSSAPEDRDVGMVFQHYALWPHLSAMDTVAYPLRRSGVGRREARRRALDLLEVMGLDELAARRPAELSGGQQQRVGLARALARDAGLYLFDEPTAHLDTPLRTTLQAKMSGRQRERGAAAVYATHDAGEALAVADRVALLRGGRIVQLGTPAEIYECPVDLWAAALTGPASVLEVDVVATTSSGPGLEVAGDHVVVPGECLATGQRSVLVRPDWAALGGPLAEVVTQTWYRGPHTDYQLDTPSGVVVIRCPGPPRVGNSDRVGWRLDRVHFLAVGED